jgi:hypothetical protein
MSAPPKTGDIRLSINGAEVPGANLAQLYPNMEVASVEQMAIKVDRLMKRYDQEVARLILQYDAVIENPHMEHTIRLRTIEAKTRLLTAMSSDASRIALTVERQRRQALERAKEVANNKKLAIKLLEHNRKAARVADVYADSSVANRQPKVRMFVPGAKFSPTVGLDMAEPEM